MEGIDMPYVHVPKGSSAIVYEDIPQLVRFIISNVRRLPQTLDSSWRNIQSDSLILISNQDLAVTQTAAEQGLPISARISAQDRLLTSGDWTEETLSNRIRFLMWQCENENLPNDTRERYLEELDLRGIQMT